MDLDELGMVTEAELVLPGVYDAILELPETGVSTEAYIVLKKATELSNLAKKFGKPVPGCSGLLVYSEDEARNTRYIISMSCSATEYCTTSPCQRMITSATPPLLGRCRGYFGNYPVPFLTPWGHTTRNKTIANGLYWLEAERCQRGLAVPYPKYDDLSDGARGLAEQFDDGSAHTNGQMLGYLFFRDTDSCVPLCELAFWGHDEQPYAAINRTALRNFSLRYENMCPSMS